ncbi:MAG TPA: ABC transporter ATP-binding protein, partial [Roseiflexaceae bacterium]|nr:ABC transporter ATP-binding protein [Roseiflexaceae bacterium]
MQRSEFSVAGAATYDHRSPVRWILSHVRHRWYFVVLSAAGFLTAWLVYSQAQVMIGRAAEAIISGGELPAIGWIALTIFALLATDGIAVLTANLAAENVAAGLEADARRELYGSLLGKSQTFHDRQRAGDVMARATDDASQLSNMIVPGATLLFETVLGIIVPIVFIMSISMEMAIIPILFILSYIIAVRAYMRRLGPVIGRQREQFGVMNAGLEETISGIEVVKASAREMLERSKFRRNARHFRDLFVKQGAIEARYLPLLLYGIALGLTFMHAMFAYRAGRIGIAEIIGVMALVNVLRFPTFISIFAFSVAQAGLAGARRILQIISATTDLDENLGGHSAPIRG